MARRLVANGLLFLALSALILRPAFADELDREGVEFFEPEIRPVLVTHCYECHAATSEKVKGKLLLDSGTGTLKGGESGAVVIAGDVEKSLLSRDELNKLLRLFDFPDPDITSDRCSVRGGEFGRTPTAQGSKGRNHHDTGFAEWLAGGGVKAVENRVSVHNLHAAILHLLGLDHTQLTYRYSGRDFRFTNVHSEVVRGALA